jgi:acyl carrier protein
MVHSGAKCVALVGRNPPNAKTAAEIQHINSHGKHLFCLQYDIGDFNKCKELLEVLKSDVLGLPPLWGIMHAAGVLSDASFANQTWEKYEKTYHPKVKGGWNLHRLTLEYSLEHFVMFSSFTALLGSAGQSNHSSATFFLDSLTAYRNYTGLPATTVNWGQWGQVGAAAEMEIVGVKPFSPLQGISALEKIMRSQNKQAAFLEKMDFSLYKRVWPGVRKYLEGFSSETQGAYKETKIPNPDQFWKSYDDCSDKDSRLNIVTSLVKSVISTILKLEADFGDEDNFQDLGMDSLMMIEMKNSVQSTMGMRVKLTVTDLKDAPNVNQLASKLTQLINGGGGECDPAVAKAAAQEELMSELAIKHPELVSQFLSGGQAVTSP